MPFHWFLLLLLGVATSTDGVSRGIPNLPVYSPGDGGRTCFRIPSLVVAGDVLYAFAESRSIPGDGCFPAKPVKGDGRTAIVFRTSTDGGATWSSNFTDLCE